ncbi:MAG: NAD(P)-binding protein [bacterium]|nr:NAD(P)-binding protein [bacterium]
MKVIIGAGPSGLYTAIKLKKAGIKDVVIFDPRAGHYYRPGHLNQNAFYHAENELSFKFWSPKAGHIKDFERALFKEAQRLNITIETKRFVRLHQDKISPGVVVQHNDMEEFIAADFVFDCTGNARRVVTAVNSVCPASTFRTVNITELPVSQHILAYVKINNSDWEQFSQSRTKIHDDILDHISPISYAKAIIKLKALGWEQLRLPRCYGMSFGKEKVCLYFHAPNNLAVEQQDLWVKTVLEAYVPGISYQHLPHPIKPRFGSFSVKAEALQQVAYKGSNLPMVIALGDAQIDYDYFLAHGILDGMKRIDVLFEHMEIFDGQIYYFDAKDYYVALNNLLKEHKTAVINAADKLRKQFDSALQYGHINFTQAIKHHSDAKELNVMQQIIKEIEARQNYKHIFPQFMQIHDGDHHIIITASDTEVIVVKLADLHLNILNVFNGLPRSFELQREKIHELIQALAISWKEIGNVLFRKKQISESIQAYQKAMDIYSLEEFTGKHILKEQTLYSNMALAYLLQKNYPAAISAAYFGLSYVMQEEDLKKGEIIRQKIVFHLIEALCAHGEVQLSLNRVSEAHSLNLEAQTVYATNQLLFTKPKNQQLILKLNELQKKLINSHYDSESINITPISRDIVPLKLGRTDRCAEKSIFQLLGIFSSERGDKGYYSETKSSSFHI